MSRGHDVVQVEYDDYADSCKAMLILRSKDVNGLLAGNADVVSCGRQRREIRSNCCVALQFVTGFSKGTLREKSETFRGCHVAQVGDILGIKSLVPDGFEVTAWLSARFLGRRISRASLCKWLGKVAFLVVPQRI